MIMITVHEELLVPRSVAHVVVFIPSIPQYHGTCCHLILTDPDTLSCPVLTSKLKPLPDQVHHRIELSQGRVLILKVMMQHHAISTTTTFHNQLP